MHSPLVAIICGSRSDLEPVEKAVALLTDLEVPCELRIISAHRAPALLDRYVASASDRGVRVFICAAGLAAHLAGAVSARTAWPVIGLPMPGGVSGGMDALLSTVQMPPGVPVATVGIGNARNAALLAAQILSVSDAVLAERVGDLRKKQTRAVEADPLNEGA